MSRAWAYSSLIIGTSIRFSQDHEVDAPLKSEELEVGDESDYVEESEVKPRDRSLPSYIKKERPIIR